MTIEAVPLVIAGGGSRNPNSMSAGLTFRGMGAEIKISSGKERKNMSASVGQGHGCLERRHAREPLWLAVECVCFRDTSF